MLSESYDDREPNIRKAKFIISDQRIYSLEFDQNIQMRQLKLMIQKAAHLCRKNFRLVSNGQDYTQYNEETYDSIFPHQNLVVFTLEINQGEYDTNDNELLLQMNTPCPKHTDKFLLYYCLTCNCSICSDCINNNIHKFHKIRSII